MLNGKPVVGLDCDDVVARCVYGMAQEIERHTGKRYTEEQITTWDVFETVTGQHPEHPNLKSDVEAAMKQKGWCRALEPFEGAIEGVKSLQYFCEVYFITAPYDSEHWEYERRQWLQKHFNVEKWRIIQGGEKCLVRPDVFVEDKLDNILKWREYMPQQGYAVLWDRPHNQTEAYSTRDFTRVRSWEELRRFITGKFAI